MAKTAKEIVERALSLIDEVPTSFMTAATTETSIQQQAFEILPEVCRDLIKELPWELKRHLGQSASLTKDPPTIGDIQSPYLKQKVPFIAPSDFWELVSIKLAVWSRPVTEYILINGTGYAEQNNPFTRAGKHSPVVAINTTSSGGNARIECFSIHKGDTDAPSYFEYISFNNVPDEVTGKTWPDELFDVVTKALATELNVIKSREQEAGNKAEAISNNLEQHQ